MTSLDNVDGGGASNYGYNGDNSPVVTLDKSYFDLFAADSNGSQFHFGLNNNYTNYYYGLNNGVAQSDVLSGGDETFDAARFSASVVGAAPEPASWALMILGFGIAGTVLRRRQQVALRIAYA